MSELDTLYLENIDEFVHDQDKIVTYKWLSLTLGVHVNTAKQMLFHYLEQKRRESSAALHATFLLSGKSVDDEGKTSHKVCVVREEELEEAKSRLRVVLSVHVYSVHKALLRDSSPLFGVDYDAVKNNLHQCNRFSAIRCPDAVPLSKAELEQRESRPAPVQTMEKTQTRAETKTEAKPKPKGIMGIFASKPKTEAKTGTKPEPKPEPKPESRPEPKPEPTEAAVSEVKPAAKSNPMANFFGNQTTKKPVVKEQTVSPPEQRPPQANRDQRSKSKRVESDSEEEEPQEKKKKRRRIRKPQSDSSDDEESSLQTRTESPDKTRTESLIQTRTESPEKTQTESPEKEEEAPAEPEPEPVPKTETKTMKIRKRRRVLKSKTFVDDEGCIVTEKVYESESFSEDDEVQTKPGSNPGLKPVPKAAPARAPEEKKKKTAAGAKNTKQASIMGFFNRK